VKGGLKKAEKKFNFENNCPIEKYARETFFSIKNIQE